METVVAWMKSIILFSIMISMVFRLLPGKQYEKYVRIFAGLLLILIVVQPLSKLFGVDKSLKKQFELNSLQATQKEIERDIGAGVSQKEKQYEALYATQIKADLIKQGYEVKQVALSVSWKEDNLVPSSLFIEIGREKQEIDQVVIETIDLSREEKTDLELENLKNQLSYFYEIPKENIDIKKG